MELAGKKMSVQLKEAHLRWGTLSHKGPRDRNEYEVYIPIPMNDARRLNLEREMCFSVIGENFKIRSSGSQGDKIENYGKQFCSKGNLQLLGHYLKDKLRAKIGDIVTVKWITNNEVSIYIDN